MARGILCRILLWPFGDSKEFLQNDPVGGLKAHLSNVTTVGSLLLGFILTGTLLSTVITGEESHQVKEVVPFLRFALAATFCSFAATVTAFALSARLTQLGMSAGSTMRSWILLSFPVVVLVECLLYVSMYCFVESMQLHVRMNYVGPNICPGDVDSQRPCAKLGLSFREAAEKLCGSPLDCGMDCNCEAIHPGMSEICWYYHNFSCYSVMIEAPMELQWEWFIWNDAPYLSPEWSRHTSMYSDLACGKAAADADKTALCAYQTGNLSGGVPVTWQEREACMQAIATLNVVDGCTDSTYASAEKCIKVCGAECSEYGGLETCIYMIDQLEKVFVSINILKIFTIVMSACRAVMTIQELYVTIKAWSALAPNSVDAGADELETHLIYRGEVEESTDGSLSGA
mmetsp:Transcript_71840/g.210469  ORF Transcript_71840/g.210469 Transcript_71840/m.210469 type:complete len:401 (+) Transcript_71840:76-1278(+)